MHRHSLHRLPVLGREQRHCAECSASACEFQEQRRGVCVVRGALCVARLEHPRGRGIAALPADQRALGPAGDLRGRAVQDRSIKVRKRPRHWPHDRTGPIWLAVRGCTASQLRPYGPLGRLGDLRCKAGPPRAHADLTPPSSTLGYCTFPTASTSLGIP
jgi:hypothetical protein